MASTWDIGDAIPLTWSLTVGGVATNGTVALTITLPDGTTVTPSVTNASTGNYTASYTATLNGPHSARWSSTGAVVAAETVTFDVGAGYCSLATLKASLGITDTNDDDALTTAIQAASRAIDQYTGTHFYTITEARTFQPVSAYDVWVDRFTSTTGLVVKTGSDGTYPTTVDSTAVLPWPFSAPSRGGAYCRLQVPTGALPFSTYNTNLYGATPVSMWPTVQVTASWGWHYVPADVAEACRIKAARIFRRKDTPEGVAGSGDFGVVRVSRYEDPDVVLLLGPYAQHGPA